MKKLNFLKRIFSFKTLKKLLKFGAYLSLIILAIVLWSDINIKIKSGKFLYTDSDSIPHNKVGVLLGTSKKLKDGHPNLYFNYRIEAAAELFHQGKVDYLLVSGDNRTIYYNEPRDMMKALVEKNVPADKIVFDFAGFRTYDSMIRTNKVFGQTSFTVISQKFHNERAVYIARRLKLDVVGYNAKDVNKQNGLKTMLREKLARFKVFLDFLVGKKPHFLGEEIII